MNILKQDPELSLPENSAIKENFKYLTLAGANWGRVL